MYGNKVFVSGVATVLGLSVIVPSIAGVSTLVLGAIVTIVGAFLVVFDK